MVRWVVGSILHGGHIELFLVPASVCACVQNMLSASLNKDERDVALW